MNINGNLLLFHCSCLDEQLFDWHIFYKNKYSLLIQCVNKRTIFPKKLICIILGPHLRHTEIPSLGIKAELKLQAYTTATAIQNPSHICNLCYSLWQQQILNLLSQDQNCIIKNTSQSLNPLSNRGTSSNWHFRMSLPSKRALGSITEIGLKDTNNYV